MDLFIFYICFEGITVPTFFIIYLFGAELTKLRASVVFLLSSFLSSGFITMALVSLYTQMKTSGIYQIMTKLRSTNSLRGSVHFPENGYYTAEDVYTYGLYYLCNFTRYKPVVSSSETGLWEMFLPLNFAQVQYFQPHLSPERILFIWLALFIGFSFKLPICPFHM